MFFNVPYETINSSKPSKSCIDGKPTIYFSYMWFSERVLATDENLPALREQLFDKNCSIYILSETKLNDGQVIKGHITVKSSIGTEEIINLEPLYHYFSKHLVDLLIMEYKLSK